MNFYAYVYRDPSRDMEPFYVGKGKGKRAYKHLNRGDMHPMTHRLRFMKKNGVEPDIEIIHAIDEDHAFFLESCLIEVIGRKNLKTGTLLNLTDGGEGASNPSEETRVKIAAAHKGRCLSPEHKTKLSEAKKGKKQLPEHVAKRAASNKGKTLSPEHKAKICAFHKGKPKSAEHCAKIAENSRNRIISDETRAKMSVAQSGRKHSDDTRTKMSKPKSPEHRAKMSEAQRGRSPPSAETRAKMSESRRRYIDTHRNSEKTA